MQVFLDVHHVGELSYSHYLKLNQHTPSTFRSPSIHSIFISNVHFAGPPRIFTPPLNQRVVNDVDVTFDCYALAEPVNSLTWYFVSADGSSTTVGSVSGTVGMTTDSGKYQITDYTSRADYGRLLVRAVQFEDRGTYMCLAENRHGTDTESATLSVQGE